MILDKIIELALLEDLSLGDITSDTIFIPEDRAEAAVTAAAAIMTGLRNARLFGVSVNPPGAASSLRERTS